MKKRLIRTLAILLALLLPVISASVAFAESGTKPDQTPGTSQSEATSIAESKYSSPDINALTGVGEEPEELSVTAGATYLEKAWYEYVTYSEHAVSSYRVNDDTRILFYDPYTYTNSLVMDVQFDATTTEFDTMSSYTISHTRSKTIDACVSSTATDTESLQTSGKDKTGSTVTTTGDTTTKYNHSIENKTQGTKTDTTTIKYKEYRYKTTTESDTVSGGAGTKNMMGTLMNVMTGAMTGGIAGAVIGGLSGLEVSADSSHTDQTTDNAAIVKDSETNETIYSNDYKTSTDYVGSDTVEYNTTATTEGWSELSARVTKSIGSSVSTSNSWSESESTTVTKTYAATHFASDGVTPLPWAIVHYSVQMPLRCSLQMKYSGEWITVSTSYCLLTTVQGTCRTWMQNGQVYYEDWGNGEPVVATDFWSQFMTKEQLVAAYSDKLYPVGGDD